LWLDALLLRVCEIELSELSPCVLIVERHSWQGEDIFMPRGSGEILVAPRFKEFCGAHDIANAIFAPAETYGRDFYPWEKNE
jgi:hypothetical protein